MKKQVLILVILIALLLCACGPAVNGPKPSETILPTETSLPAESTEPETVPPTDAPEDFSEYYELLADSNPERNWYYLALECMFSDPTEIDLKWLFYIGTGGGGWKDISAESEQFLIDQGFIREYDLQVMPVDDLEEALQSTFGISLSDVTIPDCWVYIEAENAYCSNHNDACVPDPFTITDVTEHEDGSVEIAYSFNETHYNPQTDERLDNASFVLTLQKTPDGNWLILSNVIT